MHIHYCFATKMYSYNEFICLLFHCIVYNINNSNVNAINYYILIIIILNNTIVIIITKKITKNNFILYLLYILDMDMSLMSGFMGMPGMNMGVNPLVQLLNQNGLHPNWPAGLSGIVHILIFFKFILELIILEIKVYRLYR